MDDEVLTFISHFKQPDPAGAEKLFLYGNCYWFAHILCERFQHAELYYLPIDNHFITYYKGKYYDISGQITPKDKPIKWNIFRAIEPLGAMRIERDCINKE